jgi:hypothetical protein
MAFSRSAPVGRVNFRGDLLPRGLWLTSYATGCPDLPTSMHAALTAARPSAALRAELVAAAPGVDWAAGASFEVAVAVVDASGLAALNLYHHGFLWPSSSVTDGALREGLVRRPLVGILRASGALEAAGAAALARAEHHVHKASGGTAEDVSDQAFALRLGDSTLSEEDALAQAEAMVGGEAGRLLFGHDSAGLVTLASCRGGAGAGLVVCIDDEGAAAPRVCITLLLALTGRAELEAAEAALAAAAAGGGGGGDGCSGIAALFAAAPAVSAPLGELAACFEEDV